MRFLTKTMGFVSAQEPVCAGDEQVWRWGCGRGSRPSVAEPAAGLQRAGGGLPLCPGLGCPHCCPGWHLLRRAQVIPQKQNYLLLKLCCITILCLICVATCFMCRVIHGPTSLCCTRACCTACSTCAFGWSLWWGGRAVMLLLLVEIHCSLLLLSPLPACTPPKACIVDATVDFRAQVIGLTVCLLPQEKMSAFSTSSSLQLANFCSSKTSCHLARVLDKLPAHAEAC